jgi:hypothetical protein
MPTLIATATRRCGQKPVVRAARIALLGPGIQLEWAAAPATIGSPAADLGGGMQAIRLWRIANAPGRELSVRIRFDASLRHFAIPGNSKLADRVDDNECKFRRGRKRGAAGGREFAALLAGGNFVIVSSVVTGPDGNLDVTCLSNGAVYMIR